MPFSPLPISLRFLSRWRDGICFRRVDTRTAMNLPKRFWNDLSLFPIQNHQSTILNLQSLPSLSAEGGTVLIEWVRPEECDSRSTIRWIVSKSGAVLRHRHCPPHEC